MISELKFMDGVNNHIYGLHFLFFFISIYGLHFTLNIIKKLANLHLHNRNRSKMQSTSIYLTCNKIFQEEKKYHIPLFTPRWFALLLSGLLKFSYFPQCLRTPKLQNIRPPTNPTLWQNYRSKKKVNMFFQHKPSCKFYKKHTNDRLVKFSAHKN